MIENRNFIFRFPKVFITLQFIGENEYGITGHSNLYFFEVLHEHFEAQFLFRASM